VSVVFREVRASFNILLKRYGEIHNIKLRRYIVVTLIIRTMTSTNIVTLCTDRERGVCVCVCVEVKARIKTCKKATGPPEKRRRGSRFLSRFNRRSGAYRTVSPTGFTNNPTALPSPLTGTAAEL